MKNVCIERTWTGAEDATAAWIRCGYCAMDDVEMAGSDAIGQVFDDVEDPSSDGRHRSTERNKRARRGREGPSSRNAVARGPAR